MAFTHPPWKALLLIIIALKILQTHAQSHSPQKFRVTPHDLTVLEGAEAMLRCEVSNVAGQMQWTKDGFALGFVSGLIPGFPRFSTVGENTQGVYNLRITNTSIDDDAEYQCQVGPAKQGNGKSHSPIRSNAKLTVIAPPSSIVIQGYTPSAKVEVRENQDLTLTCVVSNAKPAAEIRWYRGQSEYKPEGHLETHVTKTDDGKRFTVTSRLKLKPTSADDYVEYTCQARHKALAPDMPMKATVQLSVLYPPGEPYIEGYTPGEKLRRGQTVQLTCRSRGGNPPAQLIWYKNGAQVRMAYRTAGRLSENIYTFTAEASDNKARFRCEASNVMSAEPLKTELELSVLFAPTHLTIAGPTESRGNEQIQLTCTSAPSNPAADIKWTIGGRQIKNATTKTIISPEGGWITTSNITTTIEANRRTLPVLCHGINLQLAENAVATHTVNILHPPSAPIITGYVEGSIIPAGTITKLLCVSTGGNPLATLTWYKNDKKINSLIKTMDKTVSAELTVLANVTDNQARYRCEAQNSATEIPLFETKTLSVHFAPETVKISVEPADLKPGMVATLHCDSSSSNPPAELSWWREGIAIPSANITETKPGLWFGTVSHAMLKVNVTQEMNGIMYTCQSHNEALQRSVHEAINLQVLFPPKFKPPPSSTAVGVEGESLMVAMVATGNPAMIQYTWTKDGLPIILPKNGVQRIVSEGPILNITKLNRDDAGIYTCEAINSQGSDMINITVVVEYGASIKSISENVIVNPSEDAMLSCTVEGKPLNEEHIRWERIGYDMTVKTSTTYANGTSYLHIKDARRTDVGNFRCIADNRVANPTSRDVLLIVKFAPEIDKSPTMLKAASGANERGRLVCRAQASPRPTFIWSRGGQVINVNQSAKYTAEIRVVDSLTFESLLTIGKVAPADYGDYECQALNELGANNETINLKVTSPPDAPLELNILNVTHDSVTVAWQPGFDGGMKASYRVRYREANTEHYKYEDGIPNSQKLIINGLRMNTLYVFSVQAMNQLGVSPFLPDTKRAQTLDTPPPSQPASSLGGPPTTSSPSITSASGLLLLIGVAAGTVLVLLNILLIGCCLHKRGTKRIKRGVDPLPAELVEKGEMPLLVILAIAVACIILLLVNAGLVVWYVMKRRSKDAAGQNSKTATIEMYAPSSYNDTVTGETLSSVSEKSETYSNDGSQPDYIDETRKKAQSTYLVEGADIPPPRYQKDGTLPAHYPNNIANHTRTLPHPRHNNNIHYEPRTRDDQMLNKTHYVTAPSPGPPLDGSYYNMNSDRYLSYPPMDYSTMDFSTPPVPMLPQHMQMSGGGTLRRGMSAMNQRGMVPPPDVTQMTTLHNNIHDTSAASPNSMILGGSMIGNSSLSNNISSAMNSTPKQPQGILKDPNRPKQPPPPNNLQILNVQNAPPPSMLGGSLLITGYDPSAANLSSFNASLGYTDADGHLV